MIMFFCAKVTTHTSWVLATATEIVQGHSRTTLGIRTVAATPPAM